MDKFMKVLIGIGIAFFALFLLLCFWRPINKVSNRREITATVTDKDVKNSDGESKYLVFTKTSEGETAVFEVTDALFAGRFDSSDLYAEIEIGKTYKFDVGGSRNRLFSWYPNIYGYEEVKEDN